MTGTEAAPEDRGGSGRGATGDEATSSDLVAKP